jgi:hypothetical protein
MPSAGSEMSEIVIEYSLHEGQFWLPRTRTFKGTMFVGPMRAPTQLQQAFTYTSVNGPDTLSAIAVIVKPLPSLLAPDSLKGEAADRWRDSISKVREAIRREQREKITAATCDSSGKRMMARFDSLSRMAIATTFPCRLEALAESPDFTRSLLDPDEETFSQKHLDGLIDRALGFRAQAAMNLIGGAHPNWRYGLSMTRYNRVEGFSTGIGVTQQLGGGYVGGVSIRLGFADLQPNGEASLARTNLSRTYTVAGYNRLVSANDWGNPLSFSASLSALLYGNDQGFYYRASGGELRFESTTGLRLNWRLFAEQQRRAKQETEFSLTGDFDPNIVATKGISAGASLRFTHSLGQDPRRFRLFTDVRLEGAGGDSTYGRGAVEFTLSQGLFANLAAALTLGGGTSVGSVAPQRRWYLGGWQTIRGQRADTSMSGNAFWMVRAELGRDFNVLRPSIFADVGWVGDRDAFQDVRRPMSGVGIGVSALDGLVRVDFARGIYPSEKFRFGLTVGGRW